MSRIVEIVGREIIDSRGNPTVEADVILDSGVVGRAGFDLDEDKRAAIDSDQVELADVVAVTAGDDRVAEAAKIAGGGVFAAAAEGLGLE